MGAEKTHGCGDNKWHPSPQSVFPAKAGIHPQCRLDATLEMVPRLRGDDLFCENNMPHLTFLNF